MAARDPESELVIDVGGVCAAVGVPEELLVPVRDLVSGPRCEPTCDPVVHYRVTMDGPGRYGLERDRAGLRRHVEPDVAAQALVADLADVVHHRRPGMVLARAGAVGIDGRGVVILGPEGAGTTTLLSALVDAGATALSDGLALFDRDGRVHPVLYGGHGSPDDAPPGPLPVTLVVATAFEPGADWDPDEVAGTRAVLGLLDHVVAGQQQTAAARALLGRLAPHALELRGPRPEAATMVTDVMARAERLPVPDLPAPASGSDSHPRTDTEPARPVRARFLRFDDVLAPDEHRRLLDHALSRRAELAPSVVLTDDDGDDHADLRRSQTSFALDDVWHLFEKPLVRLLPHVRRELDLDWFELGRIERQLTVHGDGDHFTLHVDNAGPEVASRMVSAVYYFNREPRRYSGGELRLFDTVDRGGRIEPADTFTEVVPADNTLVVFPSDVPHEVRPVRVPGDDFADRRFTIVFWARRGPTVEEVFTGDAETLADLQRKLIPSLTADGFRVVATPDSVQTRLRRAFDTGSASARPEGADDNILPTGDPSHIDLNGLGPAVLDELQELHEDWCGAPLVPTVAFGLRVYGQGQTLRRHTDRVKGHVISSVVHVAADVDEPWPLVIEDALGERHEVFLEPGEMLLYEGCKLPHSRPEPLSGRHYASLFLHYRPADWQLTLARVCRAAGNR